MERPTRWSVWKVSVLTLVALSLLGSSAYAFAFPAFPGAEGYGAVTPGGRFGSVYVVTNLNDSGPGSFREACMSAGPRTVVFAVSGNIQLKTELVIEHPYITVAGQTAPGNGICISGETVNFTTHDVIVRQLRARRGTNVNTRPDGAMGSDDSLGYVIFDHCSVSWGLDENMSIYRYQQAEPSRNVTVQYSIISEALNLNDHAFGATWGGTLCSYHHNLFACNTGRNPSISFPMVLDFRNNVLYNWDHRTIDGADGRAQVNIVDNYYKYGPAVDSNSLKYRIVKPDNRPSGDPFPGTGLWYVEGNYVRGFPTITANNWAGGVQYDGNVSAIRSFTPFPAPALAENDTAEEAYLRVLAEAGVTRPGRDAVDTRIMGMVSAGTVTYSNGIINYPSNVGGYPNYPVVFYDPNIYDPDLDGMPTNWELAYGLNPNVADNNGDFDSDLMSNIEEYLADLVAWPAPCPIVWSGGTGGTAGRYEVITNWNIPWEPKLTDQAEINSGKATVSQLYQEAGTLYVGNSAGGSAELAVTAGKLTIANALHLGSASGARGTASISGGVMALGGSVALGGGGGGAKGLLNITGGSLTATGPIVLASAASSTGELTVAKNAYVQVGGLTINSGGGRSTKVSMEFDANGHSLIRTTGAATLAGVLNVQRLGSFRPSQGNKFTLILATSGAGNFGSITSNITEGLLLKDPCNPGLGYWPAFRGAFDANADFVITFQGAMAGDTGGDNQVTSADLSDLTGNWGQSGVGWAQGDFGGDGTVTSADLSDLTGNWGVTGLPPSAPPPPEVPVPEPATLALLTLVGLTLIRRRR
jgi:hypothetical protein